MKKLNALMVGSVPLSVNELQLAPAVISAEVFNRGHNFQYYDINIELYNMCNRNKSEFNAASEQLQDMRSDVHNDIVNNWFEKIDEKVSTSDVLIVNVFSILSQGAAYKIIRRARSQFPKIKILVGGIGSHRDIFGGVNSYNKEWVDHHFPNQIELSFGSLLLANNYITDWQSDVSTTVIERWFPVRPSTRDAKVIDFNQHRISEYEWKRNERIVPFVTSYGCVRRCAFCDVIKSFPKYGYIEADALTQQIIETYKNTGIAHLQFMDSLVNGSMSNFLAMLKNLAEAKEKGWLPKNFRWSGTYICRKRTPKLEQIHKHLGASGADNLIIGVETGSDKIRYTMDKKFTNDDLLYEIEQFYKAGVKCTLLFFPAWPTETLEDLEETLKLVKRLATWVYTGTIDAISAGGPGFILHEGTPIYDNKDDIELIPGPVNYLWKCGTNPTLTFWESIRRRMIMSRYSQMLGIRLSIEADELLYIYYRLENDYTMIEDYHGPVRTNIMPDDSVLWERVCNNNLKFRLVNYSGQYVIFKINYGNQSFEYWVPPGVHEYSQEVYTTIDEMDIKLEFVFDSTHTPDIQQYDDSGDYHATNGLYIDYFGVDERDATLNGFNTIFNESVDCGLPADYNNYRNERAIIANTILTTTKEKNRTLHEHITRAIDPDAYIEIDSIMAKIKRCLESRGTGSAE